MIFLLSKERELKFVKKKIMFFLYTLAGGGAERTVINIINNLDREKFKVVLVLGTNKHNDYTDFLPDDIDIRILNSKRLRFSLIKLIRVINQERPDLLFSTLNLNNIALLLAKSLTFRNIPTVVREANNRTQSGTVSIINKLMTFLFYNYSANKVIALSEGVKQDLINNFHIKENKIRVIYNPVEINQINCLCGEDINDFKKKDNERLIVSIGRLVEQKDYPTLLKAFSIVSTKVNARLLILGKGPLEKNLKDLCKDLRIDDKVVFLGFKKNPYKYLKISDVFVLSSKWEGFGHVIVEAMATGTPVISTNCNSGPSEIIGDNKYGILVPVGDYNTMAKKIVNLLNDKESLRKYSEQGLIRAKSYDAKNITKEYENTFLELI